MQRPRVVFLVGPTAIGKTEISLRLAVKINAEIISCDSMQIYKGMDIITSKPAQQIRKKIPHYLIDRVALRQEYNVSRYRTQALKAIKKICHKGKIPLFVGGSGLYMSVVIDGIFKAKTENPQIRTRLYQEAQRFGSAVLYERLKAIDPKAAQKIHPNDTKRMIRALEVFEVTSKPMSQLQATRVGLDDKYEIKIFGLDMSRALLNQRIDERVEKMFEQGLVKEVKKLLRRKISKTANVAIGLREIKGFLDGSYGLEEAKRLIQKNTRQYAKRQMTWFRKDKRINWIKVSEKDKPAAVMIKIWKKLY